MKLTDARNIAWAGPFKAWGEVREARSNWAKQVGMSNPIRFQGQYHDHETGLHYNRHRYYDLLAKRFISQDPLGCAGGLNLYQYVINSIQWIDPSGLCSRSLNNALGGVSNDNMQAHHLIPEQVWKNRASFFSDIGMYEQRDAKENGILMPDSAVEAKSMGRMFYHCGSHGKVYSPMVDNMVRKVQVKYDKGVIDEAHARSEISSIQTRLRASLSVSGKTQRRVR